METPEWRNNQDDGWSRLEKDLHFIMEAGFFSKPFIKKSGMAYCHGIGDGDDVDDYDDEEKNSIIIIIIIAYRRIACMCHINKNET